MKIILNGALGRMGKEVEACVKEGFKGITEAVYCDIGAETPEVYKTLWDIREGADVLVDFSHHAATKELLAFAKARNMPLVIATTGQTAEEKEEILAAAKSLPLFFSPNMSAGVAFLNALVKQASSFFEGADVEIIERHHNKKLDAPSGTAKMLAETVSSVTGGEIISGRNGICPRQKGEIGISSVRGGDVFGVHEVSFYTGSETFTLIHTAENRGMFAKGALLAALFVAGRKPGLYAAPDLLLERENL